MMPETGQAERSWLRAYHSVATTRRTSSSCVALKRLHDSPTTCSSSWRGRFGNSAARRSVISSTGATASMIVLSAGFADLVRPIGLVTPDRYLTVAPASLLERAPPRLVVAVPGHRVGKALLERHLRLVAELGADLVVGQRVAVVVTLAVLDVLDVRVPTATARLEQPLGQLAVGELDAAADVVDLAGAAALEHELDATAVVVDVQPVAHVEPVAVERHLLVVDEVGDEQRDDLLRVLVRPVVVGASRGRDVELVRHEVSAREQVASRLRRGVRRVGFERAGLLERAGLDRAVDLVRAHLHDARDARAHARIEQSLHTDAVGHREVGRAVDAAVDMRLGSEVEDGVVAGQHLVE